MTVTVKLPLCPSVNHCHVTTRQGRRVLTAEARSWLAVASTLARSAAKRAGAQPLETWVRVTVRVTWPDRRRRDLDNTKKLLLDSLKGIAYDDDFRALCHDDVPRYDKSDPHICVTWEAEPCVDATASTA